MDWWQFVVAVGGIACAVAMVGHLRPLELARIAQDISYHGWLVIIGRFIGGLVLQFVLFGGILGTAVWFVYWILFG